MCARACVDVGLVLIRILLLSGVKVRERIDCHSLIDKVKLSSHTGCQSISIVLLLR